MGATEAAEQLDTSTAYTYKVSRKPNAELAKKGCSIVRRKVSRMYFEERYFAGEPMPAPSKMETMSVSKDPKRGTFYVQCRYRNRTGEPKKKIKRESKPKRRLESGDASF